jgi:cell division protein FtsI/penicillin-binding protein 2
MKSYQNAVTQKNRIPVALVVFILLAVSIVGRLFYLQIIKHDYYLKVAGSQHWIKDVIPAKRGQIFATDSLSNTPYLLATNQTLYMVYANPSQIKDQDKAAEQLAPILEMKKEDILSAFSSSRLYVPLKHKLNNEKTDAIKDLDITGIVLSPENWRFYPESSLASNVIGFVNNDGIGNYGIEQKMNELLNGVDGQLKEETDNVGVKIAFGNNVETPAKNGNDVYLTIDRYIQGQAEKLLAEAVKKYSSTGGSVIVEDPKTGRILAMADYPTYDPNKFAEVTDYSAYKNPAVMDLYEPGSIFKVATMAAGLDNGAIKPDTTFTDPGKIRLDGFDIMNSDKKAHGVCTMTKVLSQSLNTGTTWVEQKLGKNLFYEYLKKFGFGSLTGIDMPDEAQGKVYKPDEINEHGYATISFGQSISATPIQMISLFSAVANNGKAMKPFVIQKVHDPNNGKDTVTKPQEAGTFINQKAAEDLTNMMIDVVVNGHGFQAKIPGYKVAGKTGTAQVVRLDGRGYEEGTNIGSFVGFAPAFGDQKYVVLAKIDRPKGIPWAEESAAPIVGQMLDYLLKYYQIPPTEQVK